MCSEETFTLSLLLSFFLSLPAPSLAYDLDTVIGSFIIKITLASSEFKPGRKFNAGLNSDGLHFFEM